MTYPNEPPKAFFRTKIFHANVDDNTGAVCVETLKRDWDARLTLRDILITISCLLIQPNPSSALNAEAGMLLEQGEDGWKAFDKRARFWTNVHAMIPRDLRDAAEEAQSRGNDKSGKEQLPAHVEQTASGVKMADRRSKRRRAETAAPANQTPLQHSQPSDDVSKPYPNKQDGKRPFVVQSAADDVFGVCITPPQPPADASFDSEMQDADQENDATRSPVVRRTAIIPSPVRQGPPVPLGELQISDDSFEAEYPPSPKKSPVKKSLRVLDEMDSDMGSARPQMSRAESSHTAAMRKPLFTPEAQSEASELFLFTVTKPQRSPRRQRADRQTSSVDPFNGPRFGDKVTKAQPKSSPAAKKSAEESKAQRLEAYLWNLCGEDVDRWNRGDFGGFFKMKAARW